MKPTSIAQAFAAEDAERQQVLDRARACAALVDPAILPPQNQNAGSKLPENYQSVGSLGTMTMEGKMLLALWPPGQPWFHLDLSPQARYDPRTTPDKVQLAEQLLYLHELCIQATLESAHLSGSDDRGGKVGFRSGKRMALSQILVTGDCLEQLTDDYRLKVYRRDQYTTARDDAGDVMSHIVKERVDPLALTPKQQALSALDIEGLRELPLSQRVRDLYTRVSWQPETKRWLVEQEVNKKKVAERDEPVSAFFSTPFRLAPGENYGRGFIELNYGDLRSLNEMELRLLEMLALMSKGLIARDYASQIRDEDLAKPSGSIIQARVSQGIVQDVGMVRFDQARESQMLTAGIAAKTQRLAKAMLMESASTPTGERVTAFQVQRVAMELEGALGGIYAPIADNQQVPLLRRTIYQLNRDAVLPPLPKEAVQLLTLTGMAAISRAAKAGNITSYIQAVALLGPPAMARIDIGVLMQVMARYQTIDEPGLVKSDAQVQADTQQAIAAQTQAAAGQKAVDVAGNVIENNVTTAAAQAAPAPAA